MKIMKKIMAVLVALTVVIPFVNVSAEETTYTPGQLVNFIKNSTQEAKWKDGAEDVGQWTNVTGRTYPGDEQYVEAFVSGFVGTPAGSNGFFNNTVTDLENATVADSAPYQWLSSNFFAESTHVDPMEEPYVKDVSKYENARIPEIKDFLDLGIIEADGTGYKVVNYDLLYALYESALTTPDAINNKIFTKYYTGTLVDVDANNFEASIWVIEFNLDAKSAEFKKVVVRGTGAIDSTEYGMVPVMYFNKDYDCHNTPPREDQYCYLCNGKYEWYKEGEQPVSCTLANLPKAKCVNSPKTGIETYAAELGIAAGICVIALVVLKRKEVFHRV